MKKNLSLLLGVLTPCVLLIGACGDDVIDATPSEDTDGSTRQQEDTKVPKPDAKLDADGPDAEVDPDASDAAGDAADASDASDADAEVPPDPAIATFVTALGAAACANYETCCAGDPNLPAAGPGFTSCALATSNRQFFGSLLDAYYYNAAVATRNRVRINPVAATACLQKVNALACIDQGVPAAVWKALLLECSSALVGVGAENDECYSDLECSVSYACVGATREGAPGTCKPLKSSGDVYVGSAQWNGDSCSYRGFAFDTGRRLQPPSANAPEVCGPQQAIGDLCVPFTPSESYSGTDVDCASYACVISDDGLNSVCGDTKIDMFYCAQYTIP